MKLLTEKIDALPAYHWPEETAALIDPKTTEAQNNMTQAILGIEEALAARTTPIEQQVTAMHVALMNFT